MIKVKSFIFNPFQENTYLLYDDTRECVIIDPGCSNTNEQNALLSFVDAENLTPVQLINTHCHIDHILGNRFVADQWELSLSIHKDDLFLIQQAPQSAAMWQVAYTPSPEPEHFFDEGDQIRFGDSVVDILHTPGHSPGSVTFYDKNGQWVIAGDVLFQQSIGRTDLPGGDMDTLLRSIREKLFPLGDDVIVYSGHGPATQIGFEKLMNPFLQVSAG